MISGSDRFVDGRGAMEWKLVGSLRVMHGDGPDISRSAAERAAAEGIWVPTTLLPRFGVQWDAAGDHRISAEYQIADYPVQVHCRLSGGLIRSVMFDRWGDPDGTGEFALHPFGGEFHDHATFDGVTIPSAGRLGWHYGTDRWEEGDLPVPDHPPRADHVTRNPGRTDGNRTEVSDSASGRGRSPIRPSSHPATADPRSREEARLRG